MKTSPSGLITTNKSLMWICRDLSGFGMLSIRMFDIEKALTRPLWSEVQEKNQ